jgi:hypothetical protein
MGPHHTDPVDNSLALSANLASWQLSRQTFGYISKNWLCWQIRLLRQLRRQIFGAGGSSVGNNLAPAANLASRQLSQQIFDYVGSSVGK